MNMKKFLIKQTAYTFRWQLSTYPIALIINILKIFGIIKSWETVAIANFILSFPFFWIDFGIFKKLDIIFSYIKETLKHMKHFLGRLILWNY